MQVPRHHPKSALVVCERARVSRERRKLIRQRSTVLRRYHQTLERPHNATSIAITLYETYNVVSLGPRVCVVQPRSPIQTIPSSPAVNNTAAQGSNSQVMHCAIYLSIVCRRSNVDNSGCIMHPPLRCSTTWRSVSPLAPDP